MTGEDVVEEKAIGEVSLGIGVDIASSILDEETSWKFLDTDSVFAVLREGVVFIGNTEWTANAISALVVDKVDVT